jgi:histidyl-tRNA synthetase
LKQKIQCVRGTRDILPEDMPLWHRTEQVVRDVFGCFGFSEIRTPVFENTALFERGIGASSDIVGKEMYTFIDRGERSLTLRPEGTASVVRAYLEHKMPYRDLGQARLFYLGPMFRYERPQAGRFRQFYQAGAELLGFENPEADSECVAMLYTLLLKLGFKELKVDINSVGCPACRPDFNKTLVTWLIKKKDFLSLDSQRRIDLNPLRVLDSKDSQDKEVVQTAPKPIEHLCPGCLEHFENVKRFLDKIKVPYVINPFLVRGLDYYTRTAFEILSGSLGAQNALAGGGRYDNLVGQFGSVEIPAVGFAVGMDRLIELIKSLPSVEIKKSKLVALISQGRPAFEKIFILAQQLRVKGFEVWFDTSNKKSIKNQMKQASVLDARVAVIVGEEELSKGVIALKDFSSQIQKDISCEEIELRLKEILNAN